MNNDSTNTTETATASTDLTTGIDYGESAGEGSTAGLDFERSDMLVPNLIICQSATPFCKKSDPKHIEGVYEGMILNTSTEQFWDAANTPMRIVPCHFETVYEEQTPKTSSDDRGKYQATHDKKSVIVRSAKRENGQLCIENGNVLIKKCVHFVMILHGDGQNDFEPAVLQFKSTNINASKKLCSKIAGFVIDYKGGKVKPATYDQIYKIKTKVEKNDKGSWYVLDIIPYINGKGDEPTIWAELVVKKKLHLAGESFRISVKDGTAVAAQDDGSPQDAGNADEVFDDGSYKKDGRIYDKNGKELF